MNTINSVWAIESCIGLAVLWFMTVYLWRPYRVDLLREQLFLIRHELFEYMAARQVPFDSEPYVRLRLMLNGMIRYAHKITFSRALCSHIMLLISPEEYGAKVMRRFWAPLLEMENGEVKEALTNFRDRANTYVAWHLIAGTPLLLVLTLIRLGDVCAKSARRNVTAGLQRVFGDSSAEENPFSVYVGPTAIWMRSPRGIKLLAVLEPSIKRMEFQAIEEEKRKTVRTAGHADTSSAMAHT
jgi:hypothetical protein